MPFIAESDFESDQTCIDVWAKRGKKIFSILLPLFYLFSLVSKTVTVLLQS
jgi:hypothetical protein